MLILVALVMVVCIVFVVWLIVVSIVGMVVVVIALVPNNSSSVRVGMSLHLFRVSVLVRWMCRTPQC